MRDIRPYCSRGRKSKLNRTPCPLNGRLSLNEPDGTFVKTSTPPLRIELSFPTSNFSVGAK